MNEGEEGSGQNGSRQTSHPRVDRRMAKTVVRDCIGLVINYREGATKQ